MVSVGFLFLSALVAFETGYGSPVSNKELDLLHNFLKSSRYIDVEEMNAIKEALADIERNTCVYFLEKADNDTVYVRVTGEPNGCYAEVGYSEERSMHTLNLAKSKGTGKGCLRHGTIVHEFLHIMGFFHMQSSHDRDQYVRILLENVQPGKENNFLAYNSSYVTNLGVEYDYDSVMHYGPYAFSVNGEPTIVPLRESEGTTMGQRNQVTEKDWLRVNRHYKCEGYGEPSNETQNED